MNRKASSNLTPPGPQNVWNVHGADSIPDDKLPPCWGNDVRMGFLFASSYPRETNPIGYDAKMRFWTEMLEIWCSECRRASFSVALLENAYRRKNVRPKCLSTVVDELLRAGKIMTEDQFVSWDQTESWSSWAVKTVVKKPAVWGFTKLKEALISTDPAQIRYVFLAHMKTVGDRVAREFETANDESSVMPFDKFKELVGDDAELVLRWMKNNRQATEAVFSNERWIKIGKEPLNEGEVSKHVLRLEISRLRGLIEEYEESIPKFVEDARANLRNNKKETARRCLKEKKSVEKKISDASKKLDNLETLLNSLMDAQSNSEMLNVYQFGISSLKAANSGLTEDKVADTMSELEDVLEETNEITGSMKLESGNDEELEQELLSMFAGDQALQSDQPTTLNLPDVPASEPSPERTLKPKPEELKFS